MRRVLPLLILILGLGIAAASGARNGDRLVRYRQAAWSEDHAKSPKVKAKAQAYVDDKGLPGPRLRLVQWFDESGLPFGIGVVLILVGAGLARRQHAADAADASGGRGVDMIGCLDQLDLALAELAGDLADLEMDTPADALRDRIDTLQAVVIEPVVAGRGQLVARHGVATFASYFSPFSAGERQLARVWSALADGHAVVAREALADARASFDEARAAWTAAG
ncbi:MAG: hypothetical protein H6733_14620 [Alphaproteobacteria bacterium]|nr:hypothetical protein [Alphaproteobacteria bacterium]